MEYIYIAYVIKIKSLQRFVQQGITEHSVHDQMWKWPGCLELLRKTVQQGSVGPVHFF
ncbi:hypothetical protein SXCC_00519 [Gluconacetobacter sp. SXCC-1]|nr:hypothetical protein SXCC_00519 [Gluconacetobacter sp. SXCC-1]